MQALLIIDVQEGLDEWEFYGGDRNNPQAEQQMQKLLGHWRHKNWPVIHVKHDSVNPESPLFPGKPGNEIKAIVAPVRDEPVFKKSVNSAFIGTGLEEYLQRKGITSVVVAGLTTEHCISTSVRMAANLGFDVTVVRDATAAFRKKYGGEVYPAEMVHNVELANLSEEFARIVETGDLTGR